MTVWRRTMLTGWGRALEAETFAARPERARRLVEALDSAGSSVCLYGVGRSYGDAALNSGGATVITTRLDRIISFDETTGEVEVEPGVTIGTLLRVFGPRGWIPPVAPGTGFVTVGGAIANDIHGKNHQVSGSFGQHVTHIELRTGAGETVSLRPGEEAFRATVGGVGLTGAILSARLRLRRVAADHVEAHERRMPNLDAFLTAFAASDIHYSVGWVDATATGPSLGRGIMEEAEITEAPSRVRTSPPLAVPIDVPSFGMSGPIVKAFNTGYYLRVPKGGRRRVRSLATFLFPLDSIRDWNRLYGKRGLHQFQCVVPEEGADVLRGILEEIAGSAIVSPLAVLKRLGPGRAGMLSFPMAGWTLAVDFPARPAAADMIPRLAARTLDAGGRVYLAKDALLPPCGVRRMYPEIDAFREVCDSLDPARRMTSDMARRLRLRERSVG